MTMDPVSRALCLGSWGFSFAGVDPFDGGGGSSMPLHASISSLTLPLPTKASTGMVNRAKFVYKKPHSMDSMA